VGTALPSNYGGSSGSSGMSIGRLVSWPGSVTGAFVPEPFGAGGGTVV
jgi:hypothetical protein